MNRIDSLDKLIKNFGEPDALIDNFSSDKYGYAIWGYDDIFQYDSKDFQTIENPFQKLQNKIKSWENKNRKINCIGFVSYDIKNILYSHINFKKVQSNFPVMWFAKPKLIKPFRITSNIPIKDSKKNYLHKDILNIKEYKRKIKMIKKELEAGNTYQINFTMNKIFKIHSNPFSLYLQMRQFAKPAFGYYIKLKNKHILSLSPEQFFNTSGSIIKSFPMKGTRPRDIKKDRDQMLKNELKNSIKDKAEHLMIVDLLRNDLGKICQYKSIKVKNLYNVNSYESVHQMVSCVQGMLNESINNIDILKALCPGGSITGAPKESSMKIIDSLENYNRGIYSGTIGYIKNNGDMSFNIAIRTMSICKDEGSYPVGGGIVWDSKAKDEWDEAQLKSKILNNFIN
tara:strand:- start:1427 stop:2620 length:1194 start_codon:yes stop_codon:yes gene_type:complete